MKNEAKIANFSLLLSIVFFYLKYRFEALLYSKILELSIYLLLFFALSSTFAYINKIDFLMSFLIGGLAFASIQVSILLVGIAGLRNDSGIVIDSLSRLVIAILIVWKLRTDMRFLKLNINPKSKKVKGVRSFLYGIIYPPKELIQLIKILVFIFIAFYFVVSALRNLSFVSVNQIFFDKTEKVGINLLIIGIQTPMMMSSRANISKTFSDYLKNIEWAKLQFNEQIGEVSSAYQQILNSSEITYESINSNGKHLWISVILILLLQVFQHQISVLKFNFTIIKQIQQFIQNILH